VGINAGSGMGPKRQGSQRKQLQPKKVGIRKARGLTTMEKIEEGKKFSIRVKTLRPVKKKFGRRPLSTRGLYRKRTEGAQKWTR